MTEPVLSTATPDELAAMVTQLGGVVLSTETVASTVALVTRLAAETIAGTIGAGVTLVDARGKRSTAASTHWSSKPTRSSTTSTPAPA